MKKIFVVCASGIATSTMIRMKITDYLEERGLDALVTNFRVAELTPDRIDADLIVATTTLPPEIEEDFNCLNGVALLTGIGEEEILEAIAEEVSKE